MATLHPFTALRPKPELAARICELPYDVMSSAEARQIAAGNPLSFLHVSKPEIDLDPRIDPYSPEVYAKGRDNFRTLIKNGSLLKDAQPGFYLYRQVMGTHSQVGLVAAASCQEYLSGVIRKHELTRPDKEDDRVRHIEALGAHTGPVFLTYHASPAIDALVARHTAAAPVIDFTASDSVRHSAWVIQNAEDLRLIQAEFAQIPTLYIADGHHRSAAAARVFQERRGAGSSAQFLTVIFPHHQMQILPYNRLLKDLNGHTLESLLGEITKICEVEELGRSSPAQAHECAMFCAGKWRTLRFRAQVVNVEDALQRLDVSLLQTHLLAPLFGIDNPRTSTRIQFVGGIRGTEELERLVNSGDYACAFSMYPTSVVDLMQIADAGGIMPPKSTWFEPKLRDGMFSLMIE